MLFPLLAVSLVACGDERGTGVVVFGQAVGNRVSWTGEYEGIPEWDLRAEAEGVQVWLTARGEDFDGTELERTFEQIIASVRRG